MCNVQCIIITFVLRSVAWSGHSTAAEHRANCHSNFTPPPQSGMPWWCEEECEIWLNTLQKGYQCILCVMYKVFWNWQCQYLQIEMICY